MKNPATVMCVVLGLLTAGCGEKEDKEAERAALAAYLEKPRG